MEFREKLQELRKQKNLTQEELAAALYVSRTAISKWESGRGYPNIDSLKAIAKYFGITVDVLLSGEELLTLAEEDNKGKQERVHDLVFGLLDLSAAALLFLPFFAQKTGETVHAVSLLGLNAVGAYLIVLYWAVIIVLCIAGVLTLALQNVQYMVWTKSKRGVSLVLNVIGALLFIVSLQPYAATFLFLFLAIKVFLLLKKQ